MNPLASVLLLLASIIWYVPLYLKQGKDKLSIKTVLIAIFFGAFPCMLLVVGLQVLVSLVLQNFNFSLIVSNLIEAFLVAAIIEEFIKFAFSRLVIGKRDYRQSDYILIFGAVGLGFQLAESFMGLGDIISSLIRSVFALHVVWQYYMGLKYYEGKKENSILKKIMAFFLPILLHGTNDFLAFMVSSTMVLDTTNLDVSSNWVIALLVFLIFTVAFIIVTVYKSFKIIKLENEGMNKKGRIKKLY